MSVFEIENDQDFEKAIAVAASASGRVDYRLTYERTSEPRKCDVGGISGPPIPNAYYGRGLDDTGRSETGSGDWDNPDHQWHLTERRHIEEWFTTAIREATHEAMEWFWVDGACFLDPHGTHENAIHDLSGKFAQALLDLRAEATP